ncbi:methyltransferase family protein [Paragemmobacter straminiformis]|uniref:methyltransferase family protein n=1 Tax=Paragemmobacter straminiformis TaxID=2045119 RepID=UPI001F5114DE|nr:methyltransferase [Gemmobacter straminiformis]
MPLTLDLPPLWLCLFLGVVWLMGQALALPLFGVTGTALAGGILALALGLMLLALREMMRARTTFIPHRAPAHLVQSGVFRLSRNPIYLGDALVLLAAILWLDVPLALPLLPLFMLVIRERFIRDEEARLRAAFGAEFDEWATRVRRWL